MELVNAASVLWVVFYLMVLFARQKFLGLENSDLSIISLVASALVLYLRNHFSTLSNEDLLQFHSKNFIVLALAFKYMIHFELLFM